MEHKFLSDFHPDYNNTPFYYYLFLPTDLNALSIMEQNTKTITLEEMAEKHISWLLKDCGETSWTPLELKHLFISGGQWQKEQDKKLLDYINEAVSALRNGGYGDNTVFGKLYLKGQFIIDNHNS